MLLQYSGGFPVGYMVEGVGYQYSLIVLARVGVSFLNGRGFLLGFF